MRVTTRGRETQKRMWPVYRRAIAEHFSSRLGGDDIDQLLKILEELT